MLAWQAHSTSSEGVCQEVENLTGRLKESRHHRQHQRTLWTLGGILGWTSGRTLGWILGWTSGRTLGWALAGFYAGL